MNNDKTLTEKFIERTDHPIWYYKELEEVDISYVIFSLLKETFVVEIDGSKHEITFGKNRKGEIGQCIKYDDIKNLNLCSFEVIKKGFKEGKWFRITESDTSDEFKTIYSERKAQYHKKEAENWYRDILSDVIKASKTFNTEQKDKFLQQINNGSYEELEQLMKALVRS